MAFRQVKPVDRFLSIAIGKLHHRSIGIQTKIWTCPPEISNRRGGQRIGLPPWTTCVRFLRPLNPTPRRFPGSPKQSSTRENDGILDPVASHFDIRQLSRADVRPDPEKDFAGVIVPTASGSQRKRAFWRSRGDPTHDPEIAVFDGCGRGKILNFQRFAVQHAHHGAVGKANGQKLSVWGKSKTERPSAFNSLNFGDRIQPIEGLPLSGSARRFLTETVEPNPSVITGCRTPLLAAITLPSDPITLSLITIIPRPFISLG